MDLGATGFGLGASLYKPGLTDDKIRSNAKQFVEVYARLKNA